MSNGDRKASAFVLLTEQRGVPPWRWSASLSVWTGSFQETSLWSWQPGESGNGVQNPIDSRLQWAELTERERSPLTSKQSPKSMWRIFPLSRSNIRLEGCLGYKNIVITLTKIDLVKKKKPLWPNLTCLPGPGCSPPWTWQPGSGCNWSFYQTTPGDKNHSGVVSERLRPSGRTDDGEPKTALISLFWHHFWISPPVTFPQRSVVSGRIIMSRVRMWNVHPPPRWLSPRPAPHLRAGALEPQELGEVVSGRVVDGVLEHLHLLHQGQVVVVWGHLKPRG